MSWQRICQKFLLSIIIIFSSFLSSFQLSFPCPVSLGLLFSPLLFYDILSIPSFLLASFLQFLSLTLFSPDIYSPLNLI